MAPHEKFASAEANKLYPAIRSSEFLQQELYNLT